MGKSQNIFIAGNIRFIKPMAQGVMESFLIHYSLFQQFIEFAHNIILKFLITFLVLFVIVYIVIQSTLQLCNCHVILYFKYENDVCMSSAKFIIIASYRMHINVARYSINYCEMARHFINYIEMWQKLLLNTQKCGKTCCTIHINVAGYSTEYIEM